jgi:hypothetical protein
LKIYSIYESDKVELNEFEFNTEALNESSAYGHQGESAGELGEVSNELEFENYVGNIWEKARRLYNSPQVGHLKNVYIAAAKDYGRKALPAIAGRLGLTGSSGAYAGRTAAVGGHHSLHPHARRQILFYRKVIRHAAHYLLNALKTGYRGPSRPIVTQAFNKASKVVSQSTPLNTGSTGGIGGPGYTRPSAYTGRAYQEPGRGVYGTSYTSGPAPAATGRPRSYATAAGHAPVYGRSYASAGVAGARMRPSPMRSAMRRGMRPAAMGQRPYPAKRGKLWTEGSFRQTGAAPRRATVPSGASIAGGNCYTNSNLKQGRWIRKGNMLILEGLKKNIACS